MTVPDLDALSPEDAEHLGHLLLERAARQRRKLGVEEVRKFVQSARLSSTWQASTLVEIGRIRAAAKDLVSAGLRPEQFAESLARIGLDDAFPDGETIAMAIAEGVKDARRLKR